MSDSVKIKVPAMLEPGSGPFVADAKSINDELTIGTQKLTNQHAINAKLLETLNKLLEDGTIDSTNYATIKSLLDGKADKEGSLSMGDVSGNPVPALIHADVAIQANTDEKGNNLYQMYLRLQELGILNNLNTTQKDSLVAAINSLLSVVESNKLEVGELDDLNTEADSIVEAINDLEIVVDVINKSLIGVGGSQRSPYRVISGPLQDMVTILSGFCGTSIKDIISHSGHFRYYSTDINQAGFFVDIVCSPVNLTRNVWVQVVACFISISDTGIISLSNKYTVWYRMHTSKGWSAWKNDTTEIENTIGNLTELQTSRKESIVKAINSLKSDINDRLDRLDERANDFDDSLLELQGALNDLDVELREYAELTVTDAIESKLVTVEPEVWNDGENDLDFKEGTWIGVFEEE